MNINNTLSQHDFKVRQLLRRYRVLGDPTIDTIKTAHDQHGETFMMKLLEIIVPNTSNFTALIKPVTPFVTTGESLDTKTLATYREPETPEEKGKVWTFWEKLLGTVAKTGDTIEGFKDNLAATQTPVVVNQQPAVVSNRSKLIYAAAGALVLIIVLTLIIRK